jgi:hypothetical protein
MLDHAAERHEDVPLDRHAARRNEMQPVTAGLGDPQQLLEHPHLILNMLEDLIRGHEIERVVLVRQLQIQQGTDRDVVAIGAEGAAVADVVGERIAYPSARKPEGT